MKPTATILKSTLAAVLVLAVLTSTAYAEKAVSVSQFVNGDWWIVGPVKIIDISNNRHTSDFEMQPEQEGSTVNPTGAFERGNNVHAKPHYKSELNVN